MAARGSLAEPTRTRSGARRRCCARTTDSVDEIELLAFVDGTIVGSAGVTCVARKEKTRHRAEFGISVDKAHWGLGIGRALTEACIECAKNAGYAQVAENKNALALYKSAGFLEYGRNPKGFRSRLSGWQERFVSHPIRSLAQAYVYRDQCQPFGIYYEKQGFLSTGAEEKDGIELVLTKA